MRTRVLHQDGNRTRDHITRKITSGFQKRGKRNKTSPLISTRAPGSSSERVFHSTRKPRGQRKSSTQHHRDPHGKSVLCQTRQRPRPLGERSALGVTNSIPVPVAPRSTEAPPKPARWHQDVSFKAANRFLTKTQIHKKPFSQNKKIIKKK